MKQNNIHPYSGISTFEDFKLEKERLILKKKIIEVKLEVSYIHITKFFSASNLLFSVAKELILPKISDFIGILIKKTEPDIQS
jgi:hypothetical protein